MGDFTFLQNPVTKQWVISAPRRAKRPDAANGTASICPFCPGREVAEEEVYRIPSSVIARSEATKQSQAEEIAAPRQGGTRNDNLNVWQLLVIKNKFPFAPIHNVIIHSPDHDKNVDTLPLPHVEHIFQTYRYLYNEYGHIGQVYIFHNRGSHAGESLRHPHSQLTVIPFAVKLEIQTLESTGVEDIRISGYKDIKKNKIKKSPNILVSQYPRIETSHFSLFCPETSQWPDEVWIAPKRRGMSYGEITDKEIADLATTIQTLIHILDLRHGNEFPFNYYIYPGNDWYLRLIPRQKTLGGFEVGTNVFVNTQDPKETMAFLQTHFEALDEEKLRTEHKADYAKHV